ncbi:hypothetical protein BJV82DRAFT_688115 [Fennellomyces sp. T-0311]|nr:hypothetical protein BJV82DRAFT_688115 [Fennellomyces sp. T-0311]
MPKIKWSKQDRETVLNAKLENKYWNWDKIANTIEYRHTPNACRLLFEKHEPTMATKRRYDLRRIRENSPPWSLPQRRRMAKLRAMDPPADWDEISKDISTTEYNHHPPESCQKYYEEIMSERQKERGRQDAKAKDRNRNYVRGHMRTYSVKRWMPEEEDLLVEMCTDRAIPWSEIARRLKRSIGSVQSKWRRMEPSLRETASSKKSKGKVVKNKNKKAAGIGKLNLKKAYSSRSRRSRSPDGSASENLS